MTRFAIVLALAAAACGNGAAQSAVAKEAAPVGEVVGEVGGCDGHLRRYDDASRGVVCYVAADCGGGVSVSVSCLAVRP